MNRYPLWKNLLVLVVTLAGLLYALPSFFDQDPAIQLTPTQGTTLPTNAAAEVEAALANAGVPLKGTEMEGGKLLLRFATSSDQLRGRDVVEGALSDRYNNALTLAPNVPRWLRAIGAEPMYLGLDLRGGIHVTIDVDMDAAVSNSMERYTNDIRTLLRDEKVRYVTVGHDANRVSVRFSDEASRSQAETVIRRELRGLVISTGAEGDAFFIYAQLTPADAFAVKKFALEQNITTLRNRVNALGVAEPIIQQQGERRIVVQLPGAQDPSRLKEILGATATLEYRLVDTEHSVQDAVEGRVAAGSKLYRDRKGRPSLLRNRVIVTGDQITDASAGFDQRSGQPAVFISLDEQGGRRMRNVTTENVGKPMAVVFIENRTETKMVEGQPVKRKIRSEEVISIANILEPFGRRFQTTGLDSSDEARNLALLLRAGALAAPIEIVEERTIGPGLGQDNIEQGVRSVIIGFVAVVLFMAFYYKVFGLIADLVLLVNLLLLVAILAIFQATLTLPGIAGMVLTVGMAVDANVLIFERIREELRNGNTPQASINAGYEKALSSIIDANVTTLIAAVVLFSFGTGPIRGFAVTLTVGLLSSLFTAITASRAIINLLYGGRRLQTLPV